MDKQIHNTTQDFSEIARQHHRKTQSKKNYATHDFRGPNF